MPSNTNLTRELAVKLIQGKKILCPACGKAELTPRYTYKKQNTEYICKGCGEIFHPTKRI